jgi:hypothetical protein
MRPSLGIISGAFALRNHAFAHGNQAQSGLPRPYRSKLGTPIRGMDI